MAIQIATIGVVFSLIFKTTNSNYLPFLSVSIVFWGYISSTITDACFAFISNEAMIKQLNLPFATYTNRVMWKNIVTLGHNLLIIIPVFLFFGQKITWSIFLIVPGLLLLGANLVWVSQLLATLSARYRDLPPIINSVIVITFYITPVMWYPELIGDSKLSHLLLGLNPVYHLLQIVRLPFLGEAPTLENWIVTLSLAIFGTLLAQRISLKTSHKIAYWL
jgi:lipopolysaccharide transport system permease protein